MAGRMSKQRGIQLYPVLFNALVCHFVIPFTFRIEPDFAQTIWALRR